MVSESLYHARSYSLESDASSYFQLDRSPGPSRKPTVETPRLHLDPFFTNIAVTKSTSPSPRSPEPTVTPLDDHPMNGTHNSRWPSHIHANGYANGHANGNGIPKAPLKGIPAVKKSLPDFRPARLHLPNGTQRAATHATDHFPRCVS